MNSNVRYNVIFQGQIVDGTELSVVKQNLVSLFKTSEKAVEQLFSRQSASIKKDCTEKTAKTYEKAMLKAGAIAILVPIEDIDFSAIPLPEVEIEEQTEQPNDVNRQSFDDDEDFAPPPSAAITNASDSQGYAPVDDWLIEPIGTILSTPKRELRKTLPKDDQFDLAPENTEVGQAKSIIEPLTPDISNLSMSNIGETLAVEQSKEKIKVADLSDIKLAELGEDMGETKSDNELLNPDISALSLADASDSMEQLTNITEVLNPDISHLQLVDD